MMQNNSKIIGVTGGIGSGKSAVSKILLSMGYPVIDADVISRNILEKGSDAYFEVIEHFGEEILLSNGEIDRKRLGEIIFNDEEERLKLNGIVHPAVYGEINSLVRLYSQNSDLVFVDVPLLFENDRAKDYDAVWVVYANEALRIQRICKRDGIDEAFAKIKIKAQMPLEEKTKLASKVIMNETSLEALEDSVKKLVNAIKK